MREFVSFVLLLVSLNLIPHRYVGVAGHALDDQNRPEQTALDMLKEELSELSEIRREQQVQRDELRLVRQQLNTAERQLTEQKRDNQQPTAAHPTVRPIITSGKSLPKS